MTTPAESLTQPGAVARPFDPNDLGLGAVVASESKVRLLNRDGSFNARRAGLGWWESQNAYHTALAMTWPTFLLAVLLTGTDETFAQQVNSRTSYRADEIEWGAKFRNIFNPPDANGILSVDVHRLDEVDPAPLPDAERVPA